MLALTQTPIQPTRVERPARALLGWMPPNEALLMLTSRRHDVTPTPEQVQLAEKLRDAVAGRRVGMAQTGLEQPAPADLLPYIGDLQKDPAAAGLINAGSRVALVDLARVCAAQPLVHVDHAVERGADVAAKDVLSIARGTLPASQTIPVPATFAPIPKAWLP